MAPCIRNTSRENCRESPGMEERCQGEYGAAAPHGWERALLEESETATAAIKDTIEY